MNAPAKSIKHTKDQEEEEHIKDALIYCCVLRKRKGNLEAKNFVTLKLRFQQILQDETHLPFL